jgi:hypothetical protein
MRRILLLVGLTAVGRTDTPKERTVLTGKVVDPAGKLFPGARVLGTVDFYDPDNKSVAERFPASGLSVAADGTFVVREGTLRPGVKTLRFRMIASADGYSTSDEVVSVPIGKPGYAAAIVALRPGVDHHVRVVDDMTQAPIAGAIVTSDCTTLQQRTPVATDGSLHLRGCDDRNHNPMMAEAPGYRIGGINPDYAKPVDTIVLSKVRPLRLHVVDAATGAAVAGCDIYIERTKRTTDPRGFVDHLATYGTVVATPSCPGYGINLDAASAVTFGPADAAAPHELKVRHNFSVDGQVVDAKARPLAGIGVEIRPVNEISTARPMALATTTTDKTGHFHFDSFSADTFLVYAASPTWTSAATQIVWKTQQGPITLVAKPVR